MSDLAKRIAELSPDKRELLQMLLHEKDTASVWKQRAFVAPTNMIEEQMASLWSAVLGVARVGIHDNYFELGGDSIQAIQVISRARQHGFRFTTNQLFDHPTIAELAKVVHVSSEATGQTAHDAVPQLQKPSEFFVDSIARDRYLEDENIEDIYQLSPMQQGMLFQMLANENPGLYLEQGVCTLQGNLDIPSFEAAWREVLARHSILRTGFAWQGVKEPIQVVHRQVDLPIACIDWRGMSESEQREQIGSYLQTNRTAGVDLNNPPLMRLLIARLDQQRYHIIWGIHHLIHDAWSTFLLLKEVFNIYEAMINKQALNLSPVRPYRDYVAWICQQNPLSGEQFWRSYLGGFRTPSLLPGANLQGGRKATEMYGQLDDRVDEDIVRALNELVRQHHLTLNAVVVACWSIVLARYGKQNDVVFGVVVSGRPTNLDNIESMVGLFINTLPARVKLQMQEPLLDFAKRLHAEQKKLQEYAFTPLNQIQQWSDVPRGTAVFETVLVFQNAFEYISGTIGSLQINGIRSYGHSNLPLTIRITPGNRMLIEVLYDEQRISSEKAIEILTAVKSLLTQIATTPTAAVADVIDYGAILKRADQKRPSVGRAIKLTKPKPVKISSNSLVKTGFLPSGPRQPLLIQPEIEGLNLTDWVKANLQWIETNLIDYGALLFRDFDLGAISTFEQFINVLSSDLLEYRERSTPRTDLGGRIYTSTEYPAHQEIAFHNEFSYAKMWPLKICFHCVIAAERGGETPIADSRKVYELLDPEIRKRWEEKQVMYVRNFGSGIDLSWQEVFQTSDRQAVEEYCRNAPMEWEWRGENGLRTRQVRPAVARHPKTGAMVWFNQAHLFHLTNLDAGLQESMLRNFGEENLPRQAYYGDGTPIETSVLDEIREAYEKSATRFLWRQGDLLLLDNMLTAHGRGSFVGPRKIVVAMAESYSAGTSKPVAHAS